MQNDTPSKSGVVYPKDFSLINLTLLTPVKTFDMKTVLTELSYHEDIFNNTASGYLMITESMGYLETLNMVGNEYIRMTFGKTSDEVTWTDKLFRIYKVDRRKLEGNMNTESYSLYFCSDEMLLSEQYKISKSYKGKSVFNNINDIMVNYLKIPEKKIGIIEDTYGVYDFIIPNLKPFDAINWLSTYARPLPDKVGADMVFFEDRYGFNFRSLQSMIMQQPYHTYVYESKNISEQDIQKKIQNVMTYEILDSFDSLDAINSGVFANKLISVDPLLRRYRITNFDYADYFTKTKKLNKYPITNNFKNRMGDGLNATPEAVTKLVFSNFDQQDSSYVKAKPSSTGHNIFAETYVPYRTAQLQLTNYARVKISVPGDPLLSAGMVIGFDLLSLNPNEKKINEFYSGNYLISAVRHMITPSEYKTVLEITKESTRAQYSGVDNNSTIWKNTVKGIT